MDPFAGSGTTLVAAARTRRIGIGYDTDLAYVELATERLDAEQAALSAGGEADPALAGRGHEERHERSLQRAVDEGKKAHDIAKRHLIDAGFAVIREQVRHPSKLAELSFLAEDTLGRRWWVDVAGAYITGGAGAVPDRDGVAARRPPPCPRSVRRGR